MAKDQPKTETTQKAPAFKVKKNLTLPLLKPQLDTPFYITIDEAIFEGKKIDSGAQKDMEAAHLANVTNLETGEKMQIIVPAVLLSILNESYADNAYVGKGFQITKHPKASGKRYHAFSVAELEL